MTEKPKSRSAPWNEEEIAALERWQRAGFVHEVTCPYDHREAAILDVTPNGLVCPVASCRYVQKSAPEIMFHRPVYPLA